MPLRSRAGSISELRFYLNTSDVVYGAPRVYRYSHSRTYYFLLSASIFARDSSISGSAEVLSFRPLDSTSLFDFDPGLSRRRGGSQGGTCSPHSPGRRDVRIASHSDGDQSSPWFLGSAGLLATLSDAHIGAHRRGHFTLTTGCLNRPIFGIKLTVMSPDAALDFPQGLLLPPELTEAVISNIGDLVTLRVCSLFPALPAVASLTLYSRFPSFHEFTQFLTRFPGLQTLTLGRINWHNTPTINTTALSAPFRLNQLSLMAKWLGDEPVRDWLESGGLMTRSLTLRFDERLDAQSANATSHYIHRLGACLEHLHLDLVQRTGVLSLPEEEVDLRPTTALRSLRISRGISFRHYLDPPSVLPAGDSLSNYPGWDLHMSPRLIPLLRCITSESLDALVLDIKLGESRYSPREPSNLNAFIGIFDRSGPYASITKYRVPHVGGDAAVPHDTLELRGVLNKSDIPIRKRPRIHRPARVVLNLLLRIDRACWRPWVVALELGTAAIVLVGTAEEKTSGKRMLMRSRARKPTENPMQRLKQGLFYLPLKLRDRPSEASRALHQLMSNSIGLDWQDVEGNIEDTDTEEGHRRRPEDSEHES
ncbi:hypothetical protein DFH06DRAFT_1151670 [Mycena polygramma]|nr:hypothetical protein DFH06DRAFT_1151670 [Mycena polygramma]